MALTNKQVAEQFARNASGQATLDALANKPQRNADSGTMHINSNVLLSYSTAIARISTLVPTGDTVVLVTTRKYSVTTSKQTSLVLSELSQAGVRVIRGDWSNADLTYDITRTVGKLIEEGKF